MLAHCLTIGARGIGQGRTGGKDAGLEIGIRPGGEELQQLQPLRGADPGGRRISDDDLGALHLFPGHFLPGGIGKAAAGRRGLQLLLMTLLHAQIDKNVFQ